MSWFVPRSQPAYSICLSIIVIIAVASAPVYSTFHHLHPTADKQTLQYIVRQTTDKTCGPASLATVLTYYFNEDITERELYEAALEAMLGPEFKHMSLPVITLRGLLGALASAAYTGYALQMDAAGIETYFASHHVPMLLHLHYPTSHFTVLLGVVDGMYVLADPSLGHVVMTADELLQHWSGNALLIQPPPGRVFNAALRQQLLDAVGGRVQAMERHIAWL